MSSGSSGETESSSSGSYSSSEEDDNSSSSEEDQIRQEQVRQELIRQDQIRQEQVRQDQIKEQTRLQEQRLEQRRQQIQLEQLIQEQIQLEQLIQEQRRLEQIHKVHLKQEEGIQQDEGIPQDDCMPQDEWIQKDLKRPLSTWQEQIKQEQRPGEERGKRQRISTGPEPTNRPDFSPSAMLLKVTHPYRTQQGFAQQNQPLVPIYSKPEHPVVPKQAPLPQSASVSKPELFLVTKQEPQQQPVIKQESKQAVMSSFVYQFNCGLNTCGGLNTSSGLNSMVISTPTVTSTPTPPSVVSKPMVTSTPTVIATPTEVLVPQTVCPKPEPIVLESDSEDEVVPKPEPIVLESDSEDEVVPQQEVPKPTVFSTPTKSIDSHQIHPPEYYRVERVVLDKLLEAVEKGNLDTAKLWVQSVKLCMQVV